MYNTKIKVRYKATTELARRFGCSSLMVHDALNGLYNNELANAIRAAATEKQYAPLTPIEPVRVRRGATTKLAARFGCNTPTVTAALQGKTRSKLANAIREAAKEEQYTPAPPKSGKKSIRLEVGDIPKIAKECNCSVSMVKRDLSWEYDSDLANKIRQKAIERTRSYGGRQQPLKTKIGAIATLAKIFSCHYNTAYHAINGVPKSDLQRKIRAKAYELGLVIEENK